MTDTDWGWRLEKVKARDPRVGLSLSREDITGRTLSTLGYNHFAKTVVLSSLSCKVLSIRTV